MRKAGKPGLSHWAARCMLFRAPRQRMSAPPRLALNRHAASIETQALGNKIKSRSLERLFLALLSGFKRAVF
jgi:hypothetical protein